MDNYDTWALELADAERDLMQTVPELQRALAFITLGAAYPLPGGGFARIPGVILRMPVDSGRARSSVNVAVGSPDTSVPSPGTHPPPDVVVRAASALATLQPYDTVWVTSSLVYMPVIEFGGYPSPVLRGTWDKALRRYVVRSTGGFSRQAPQGVWGITFREIETLLQGVG